MSSRETARALRPAETGARRRAVVLLLRFFAAAGILLGAIAAFRFALYPALERLLELPPPVATVIRRGGVLAAALGGYWLSVRVCDRRPVPELRPALRASLLAALGGSAMIGLTIGALFAAGLYVPVEWRMGSDLLPAAGFLLVAALIEEVLFRGLLFQRLEEALGSTVALWTVSGLFGALHLFNSGADLVAAIAVTVLGALWCAIFAAWRNLWVVTAHHWAWNLTILCSGVPLSGLEVWQQAAPLITTVRGPAWLTGGSFGPESSPMTILGTLAAVVILSKWADRNGRLRPRSAHHAPASCSDG